VQDYPDTQINFDHLATSEV